MPTHRGSRQGPRDPCQLAAVADLHREAPCSDPAHPCAASRCALDPRPTNRTIRRPTPRPRWCGGPMITSSLRIAPRDPLRELEAHLHRPPSTFNVQPHLDPSVAPCGDGSSRHAVL